MLKVPSSMMYCFVALATSQLFATSARAAIKSEPVQYQSGDTTCKSVLYYDDAVSGKRPGILVFPEWWGLTDYPKHRAEQLAQLGYVAMAVDIYGNGKVTDDAKEAGAWAGPFRQDRSLLRQRVTSALDALKARREVDDSKIAAIGYCFGGTAALELARSGADVVGIVGFHAGLDTPTPQDAKNIKGKVLICNGGDDAFTPPEVKAAFEKEMRDGKVDWQMIDYGGAVHAFTNPDADRHGTANIAYNKQADERSWEAMKTFFKEIFGG